MVVVFEDGVFLDVGEGYVMAVCWRDGDGHSSTDAGNTACFPGCCVSDCNLSSLRREGLELGDRGDEPGYNVAAGVGEETVRWATEMCSHT